MAIATVTKNSFGVSGTSLDALSSELLLQYAYKATHSSG